MASMCATGRATFRLATAKKAFREARLLTPFFRVFKRLLISRGSTTPHSSIRTWRLSCEHAPVLRKPARSADCDGCAARNTGFLVVDGKTSSGSHPFLDEAFLK